MKTPTPVAITLPILLLLGALVLFWHGTDTGATVIRLSGNAGVPFTGYYIQSGHRTSVVGILPWHFEGTNVTSFEFRKVSPADTVLYEIRHSSVGDSFQAGPVGSTFAGIRAQLGHRGMSVRRIRSGA